MMNPQYIQPGQNNNSPNNPLDFPPSGQDFNGHQNANIYPPMPTNGPPSSMMPQKPGPDVTQKLQNMNLNGPQGYSAIPPGQLPPGVAPPTSMMGQPPNQRVPQAFPPNGSNRPQQFPQQPMSTPGHTPVSHPQFQVPPQSQKSEAPHSKPFLPPSQVPPSMASPLNQPSQLIHQGMPQNIPQNQPGFPSQPNQGVPPGFAAHPGMPGGMQTSQAGPTMSGLPHMPPPLNQGRQQFQPTAVSQPGTVKPPGPATSFAGMPQMPSQQPPMPGQPHMAQPSQQISGQPPISQPSQQLPGQPPMSQQFQQMPGQPPMSQPSQMPGQPPMSQPSQMPGQPPMSQPSQMPGQPPMSQPSQMPGQPPMSQPSHMPGQSPMSQPSQMPGQPPMSQPSQIPGQPPMSQQMPRQPPMSHLPQPMPGQPPMMHQQLQQPMMGQPPMPAPSQQPQFQPMHGQPAMSQPSQQFQTPQPMAGQPPMSQPHQQFQQMPGRAPISQHPQHIGQVPPGPPMPQSRGPQGQQPPISRQPQQQQPSGYPPQAYPNQAPYPGQQPSYPNQYPGGYQQEPQQMKRLDPDQMPSPMQVMADDQQARGGIFVTNDLGLVPPLVTTDFIVDDKGNTSPRYMRSSMYSVPVTADLLKQTALPFCLVISPMAETVGTEPEPLLLDFAALTNSVSMGPVRCSRCKAYICSSMKFIDGWRHFKCAFCKATTEVPMEYTQYVNTMQQYGRLPAELALGTYEIVATKEYCRNNTLPNPPAVVFVIDVSYNAVKSGLVRAVCDNIMRIISEMPKDPEGKSWTRVGFITYSSTVHFYNIKGTLAQPQMLSVGDVGDMFVPLLEGFLVRPEDSGPVLQALVDQLPAMFADNKDTEIILLPAVQAGLEALKAADTAGHLLVFHTSLPTYPAPGKLNNREDRKLLGTEKEKQILNPQTTAYNELGQACSAAGVCVEMFVANNSYVDAATIGQLPRLSGGQLHKYTYFQADMDGERLISDVIRVVTRPTGYDAVMRVRTSTGVRATDFYGHFFMSNTTDVELAAVDADKAIGVEIKHDDKLTGEDGVYVQAALLYTHRSGQRRLRIHNLALTVAQQLTDVYRSCELDTIINFLTKQAVWVLRDTPPRQVREGLSSRCARSLAAYRRHCASPSSAGQLVLPESCKLLPLYTCCVLRSDAIAGGPDITCDDRSCAMYRALTADVSTSVVLTYPRLLPLHRLYEPLASGSPPTSLQQLRASVEKMNDQGVYLLENGVHMLLWVGSQAAPEFVKEVFGVQSPQQIDTQVAELPELDTELNIAARVCIEDARVKRRKYMRLTIMRQHDKLETVLRHFLVEDRGVDGSASYVDYLCHIHKEIRALL